MSNSVTHEQFAEACRQQRKAKAIEKAAKEMKDQARLVILTYARENPSAFRPAAGSTGATQEWYEPVYKGIDNVKRVQITYPMSAGKPARFDAERAGECAAVLEDTGLSDAVDALFETRYAFRTPEAVVEFGRQNPEKARQVAETLLPFTLPAEEPERLSPRVEVE